jgi:acyl-CoA thioester hydrolase
VTGRADYPHLLQIPTRWNDNDVYGHLNNVEFYAFFDTVINAWLIAEGGLDIRAGQTIGLCAESHCEFTAALAFPETVDACLRVGHLGRSSVRYEIGLFGQGAEGAVGTARWGQVFVDRETRSSVEIPPRLRSALERLVLDDG